MHDIQLSRVGVVGDREAWRVLVDRLWPRGVSRGRVDWNEWLKDAAPSTQLRRWYAHDPARHAEFVRRYQEELADAAHAPSVARLKDLAALRPLALLTSTRSIELSHLPALRMFLSR